MLFFMNNFASPNQALKKFTFQGEPGMQKLSLAIMILMQLCLNSFLCARQAQPDTLNGLIEEYKQENDGQVISVVINVLDADFNTISYIIEDDIKGRELLDHIGETTPRNARADFIQILYGPEYQCAQALHERPKRLAVAQDRIPAGCGIKPLGRSARPPSRTAQTSPSSPPPGQS